MRFVVSLAGHPVVAGDPHEGLDGALGRGEEGVGLHRHVGREFRDPEGCRLEPDGGVRLFAAVGGAGCGGAGLGDLLGVERPAPTAEETREPTMRWKYEGLAFRV